MDSELKFPKTLQEAIKTFSDPEVAHKFAVKLRWPNGVCCPYCGCLDLSFISTRRIWACKACKKRFSVKVATIMEDSPLKLETWLTAIWLITGAKNGISSCEVARALGVCQKTAWFLLHRVRHILQTGSMAKIDGTVEADETFVGGLEKNKHKGLRLNKGRGTVGKQIVMGILERGTTKGTSKIRVKVIPDTKQDTLHAELRENVSKGSNVYTDAHKGYQGLTPDYKHKWVDHAVKYVDGQVHTNGCENFWSLFDRMFHGTYTHIDPRHLQPYLDEQAYRFNSRRMDDGMRFANAASKANGKRLTYKQLTERGLKTIE